MKVLSECSCQNIWNHCSQKIVLFLLSVWSQFEGLDKEDNVVFGVCFDELMVFLDYAVSIQNRPTTQSMFD